MQSGRLDVATEKLLKAVQYNENYPEAHNALGVLYEELREYGPAETHFKRAMELKSDYTLAKLNYARLLCTREPIRPPRAKPSSRKSSPIRPTRAPTPPTPTPASGVRPQARRSRSG